MKFGLMVILIAGIITILAYGDGNFTTVCKAETSQDLSNNCIYISNPSFNISEFFGGSSEEQEYDKTDLNSEEDNEQSEAINYELIDKEISDYVESTIPRSQGTFSSTDLLVGEIARANVKMTVSPLRFSSCDKLLEPEEEKPVDDEVLFAKAETAVIETSELYVQEELIDVGTPTVARKPATTEKMMVVETGMAISKADIDPVKSIKLQLEVTSTKAEAKASFNSDVKRLQRIWSKKPAECIKLATELLAAGNIVPEAAQAEIWYRKGRSHRIKGEPLSALEAHRMATELAPDSDSYLNGYAWILSTVRPSRYRNQQLALVKAKEAVNISNRGTANYLDTLARILHITGETEEAFQVQREAVQLAPGRKSFRRRLKKYEALVLVAD